MRCPNKWLKVQLIENNITIGDMKLYIDHTFEPQDHVSCKGIVTVVPERLPFDKTIMPSMEWKTDIEVQVGDTVWMDYHAVLLALGKSFDEAQESEEPLFDDDGVYIKYQDLFMAQRDEEFIMLNGYVLISLESQKMPDTSLIIHDRIKSLKSKRIGKVVKVGNKNTDYLHDNYVDGDVNVGDHVVFMDYANRKLEQDLYKSLGEDLHVVQGRFILGVVDFDKVGVLI